MTNIRHNIKKSIIKGSNIKSNISNFNIVNNLFNKNKFKDFLFSLKKNSLFLNQYPNATVAYSVFKLNSAYDGNCIRVRRSSGNTERDIGFVNNYLDIVSLLSFVGAGNGYVVKIYDQGGNSNDLVQPVAINQPLIVNSGTLNTVGGKASILFDGIDDYLDLIIPIANNNLFTSLSVIKRNSSGTLGIALQDAYHGAGSGCYTPFCYSNDKIYLRSDDGFNALDGTDSTANQQLLSSIVNGSTKVIYKNNSVLASTYNSSSITSSFTSLGLFNNTIFGSGNFQEMILYGSDKTVDISAMNTNRMTAFGL